MLNKLLLPHETKQAMLVEKNLHNAFIAMSNIHKKYDNTQYVFSNIPHPVFNCVIDAKATGGDVLSTIKAVTDDYERSNTPHCWWISERSQPENFGYHLDQMGFQSGLLYHGMHADLQNINLKLKNTPNVSIERISKIDDLDRWIQPVQAGFDFSDEVTDAFLTCFKKLFSENDAFIHYLAFYDKQLAGAATLFLDEDSAGLYNGAVFPKFQKQGVMTQLGNAMLREAKDQGYNDVVVQVNDTSHRISVNAGFKEYLHFQAYLSSALKQTQ